MARGKDERDNDKRRPQPPNPYEERDPAPPHGIPRPKKAKPYDWAEEGNGDKKPPHNNWWNN